MNKIRGKFAVHSITRFGTPDHASVKLSPLYDDKIPEDQRFAKATPSGSLEMYLTNPAVIAELQPGKQFYLDLVPVEAAQ